MRLHVWDKLGHGYPVDGVQIVRYEQLGQFEASWKQATILAIHTGEELWNAESIVDVATHAIQSTNLHVLLFSGGGSRRPNQIRSDISSPLRTRLHALSDSEFSLRVRQALSESGNHIRHLIAPDRSLLIYEVLNAMFQFQLHLAEGSPDPMLDELRVQAREHFRSIDGQWGQAPRNPLESKYGAGEDLNSSIVNNLLLDCLAVRDPAVFGGHLKEIRDSLIAWASPARQQKE